MDKLNLPSEQPSQQELSANEFQEKLYNWLLDQGLISDLRGHLRMQMVTAFQDNAASAASSKQFSVSPKVQALTTLVADFLLHQKFSYTLSVFVTEVPVIGQVFSHFSQSAIKKTLETGYKFTPREAEDILETLGLVPCSELFMQTVSLYHNNPEPLLLCIVRALSMVFNNRKEPDFPVIKDDCRGSGSVSSQEEDRLQKREKGTGLKEGWLEGLDDPLLKNSSKLCPITCLQEYMKRVHEEELCKVREEEAEKYNRLLEEKLKEFERTELTDKHSGLKDWKESVEAEFNERERNLCQLANQLRAQHMELSDKLVYLELESQGIKEREQRLKDDQERDYKELECKKSEIELQRERLNEAYKRLAAEQDAVSRMQKQFIEKEESLSKKDDSQQKEIEFLKKIQEQYDSLCQMLSEKKSFLAPDITCAAMNIVREDKGLQTSFSVNTAPPEFEKEVINRIENEKQELNERVLRQRQRIDELTIRAAELSNQLQDAQVALQLVGPNQLAVTAPPLTAPPAPTLRLHPRPQWPPHIGSGEETTFAAMRSAAVNPTVTSTAVNTSPVTSGLTLGNTRQTGAVRRPDLRRRPRRTLLQHNRTRINLNISSDDSTATTDEVIEEARIRLRRLEQESMNVQHNYDTFRNRQSNLDSTASFVFHPEQLRNLNPFDSFRRTNYSSSFPAYQSMSIRRPLNHSRSFASRFSHLSVSRPLFSSFFAGYDQPHGDVNIGQSDVLRSGDTVANELDESLRNDVVTNTSETVREHLVPPIRTTSPTDINEDMENGQERLKRKVVQNTLKNHSKSVNEKKSPSSVKSDKNTDSSSSLSVNLKEKLNGENSKKSDTIRLKFNDMVTNGENIKKCDSHRLKFNDMVTVVNDTPRFCINNEIPVCFIQELRSSKRNNLLVQEPLKTNDSNITNGKKDNLNRGSIVEVVDVSTDSDSGDVSKMFKSDKRNKNFQKYKTESDSDLTADEKLHTTEKHDQDDRERVPDNKTDLSGDEKSKNSTNIKKLEKDKAERSAVNNNEQKFVASRINNMSSDDLKDDESVEVLLRQRSIKTSSSSTHPFSGNKHYESSQGDDEDERCTVNSLESERNPSEELLKSLSLPVPERKSFFSSDEDGYTLKNFESGGIAVGNSQKTVELPELKSSNDDWFDVGSSYKIDKVSEKENSGADIHEEKSVISMLGRSLTHHDHDEDLVARQFRNNYVMDPVFQSQFDHCNYPYPAYYRNLLRKMLTRNFKPNWLFRLKLTGSNSYYRKCNHSEINSNPLCLYPIGKSFFDSSSDDDVEL